MSRAITQILHLDHDYLELPISNTATITKTRTTIIAATCRLDIFPEKLIVTRHEGNHIDNNFEPLSFFTLYSFLSLSILSDPTVEALLELPGSCSSMFRSLNLTLRFAMHGIGTGARNASMDC